MADATLLNLVLYLPVIGTLLLLFVRADGAIRALTLAAMLLQLAQLELDGEDFVRAAGHGHLALQDLRELRPALRALVKTLERLEGLQVLRLDLGYDAVARDGLLDIPDALLEHLRCAQREIDDHLGRVRAQLGDGLVVEAGELRPGAELL